MGNSNTAKHSNGREVYDPFSLLPPFLRDQWPRPLHAAFARLASPSPTPVEPPTLLAADTGPAPPDAGLLRDRPTRTRIERLARRLRLDAADVALLWPRPEPRRPEAVVRRRVGAVLRLEAAVVAGLNRALRPVHRRIGRAHRARLRTHLVAAAARLGRDGTPDARDQLATWLAEPSARRRLERAVGEALGVLRAR